MSRESTIQQSILDWLNSQSGCIAENVHGNVFTGSGRPDINACYKGRCIRIEVKTADNGNKASPTQILNMKKWSHAGALCFVAYSLDEVKEAFENCVFNSNTCMGCSLASNGQCFLNKYRL